MTYHNDLYINGEPLNQFEWTLCTKITHDLIFHISNEHKKKLRNESYVFNEFWYENEKKIEKNWGKVKWIGIFYQLFGRKYFETNSIPSHKCVLMPIFTISICLK